MTRQVRWPYLSAALVSVCGAIELILLLLSAAYHSPADSAKTVASALSLQGACVLSLAAVLFLACSFLPEPQRPTLPPPRDYTPRDTTAKSTGPDNPLDNEAQSGHDHPPPEAALQPLHPQHLPAELTAMALAQLELLCASSWCWWASWGREPTLPLLLFFLSHSLGTAIATTGETHSLGCARCSPLPPTTHQPRWRRMVTFCADAMWLILFIIAEAVASRPEEAPVEFATPYRVAAVCLCVVAAGASLACSMMHRSRRDAAVAEGVRRISSGCVCGRTISIAVPEQLPSPSPMSDAACGTSGRWAVSRGDAHGQLTPKTPPPESLLRDFTASTHRTHSQGCFGHSGSHGQLFSPLPSSMCAESALADSTATSDAAPVPGDMPREGSRTCLKRAKQHDGEEGGMRKTVSYGPVSAHAWKRGSAFDEVRSGPRTPPGGGCACCGADLGSEVSDDDPAYPDIERTSPQASRTVNLVQSACTPNERSLRLAEEVADPFANMRTLEMGRLPRPPPLNPPSPFKSGPSRLCEACSRKPLQRSDAGSPAMSRSGSPTTTSEYEYTAKLYRASLDSGRSVQSPWRRGCRLQPNNMKWKKGALIGQGGFGKVHIGLNTGTGELMAVKNIQFNRTDPDIKTKLQKMQIEIQTMKTLDHPNIVKYFYTERTGDSVNVFMEYVPGGSLADLVSQFGAMSLGTACYYTRQILMGLKYLHSQHVIHRDIKGANILITVGGECKLGDFGAAALLHGLQSKRKSVAGTPMWMAPEVIMQQEYNESVDIWSLGCTVIEMLTANAPFAHLCDNQLEYLRLITSQEEALKLPDECLDDREITDLLRQCLQYQPNLRPSAMRLMLHSWILKAADHVDHEVDSEGDSDEEEVPSMMAITAFGLIAGDATETVRAFFRTWLLWLNRDKSAEGVVVATKAAKADAKLRLCVQRVLQVNQLQLMSSYYNNLRFWATSKKRQKLEIEYNESAGARNPGTLTPEDQPMTWSKIKSCRTFKKERKDSAARLEEMQTYLLTKAIPAVSSVPNSSDPTAQRSGRFPRGAMRVET